MDNEEQQPITVREAGRRGGNAVKNKYGPEYYSQIGKIGGERTKSKYGPGYYEEIGKKGGKNNGK